jgi:hypothetical protein
LCEYCPVILIIFSTGSSHGDDKIELLEDKTFHYHEAHHERTHEEYFISLWSSFIITGNPVNNSLGSSTYKWGWNPYTESKRSLLRIGEYYSIVNEYSTILLTWKKYF